MTVAPTIRRDPPHYVYVTRPRCPECGEVETLLAYRTVDNGDGSKTRYAHCRSCHARVVIILE
ncbi:MAG: hypothetical protein GX594_13355 [Pirellulaceae bacterium]|nr:hypothetical protein [Pirellulaceae bacterium]